jgi:hypothetical protein
MTDASVHLSRHVLPPVPLRQWVCSLPWRLRYLLGYDKALCAGVMTFFVQEVMRSLRSRAKRSLGLRSVKEAFTGTVTFIQRFDSALRLNVHFHVLALDGVYVEQEGQLRFHPLGPPTKDDVEAVARRTADKAEQLLRASGRTLDGSGEAEPEDDLAEEHPALSACYAAATQGMRLLSDSPAATLRLVEPTGDNLQPDAGSDGSDPSEPLAQVAGFNVHAKVAIDGRDQKRVERMCRYLTRPPIATDRLHRMDDGRYRFDMKRTWSDGTHAIVFEPLDLVARICALVAPPRFNMIRFHGVFAPGSRFRHLVVPTPPPDPHLEPVPTQLELFRHLPERPPYRHSFSWIYRHVFREDVDICPNCGGAMRWIQVAISHEQIAEGLARLGLAPRPPPNLIALPGQLSFQF